MGSQLPCPLHDVDAVATAIATRCIVRGDAALASPYRLGHLDADPVVVRFVQSQAYLYSRAVHTLHAAHAATPETTRISLLLQRDYETLQTCTNPAQQRELCWRIDTNMLELAVVMRLIVSAPEARVMMRARVYKEAGRLV